MKANTPEQLYISEYDSEVRYYWHPKRLAEKDVEYVRKDVLIKKVCDWLSQHADVDDYTWYDEIEHASGITDKCIEDFKKYMKGE